MRISIPKPVIVAVALLFVTHAVGLWQMVLLSRELSVPLWMPYCTLAFVYLFLTTLLAMILRRRGWARNIYTVLGVISLLAVTGRTIQHSPAAWLLLTTKAAALILLLAPSSNSWFAASSPNHSFKPTSLRDAA